MYRSRDFVETQEGLCFAVLSPVLEQGRLLAALRYQRLAEGWRKLRSQEAADLLRSQYSQYLFDSPSRNLRLPGIPIQRITRHYSSTQRLQELVRSSRHHQNVALNTRLCPKTTLWYGSPSRNPRGRTVGRTVPLSFETKLSALHGVSALDCDSPAVQTLGYVVKLLTDAGVDLDHIGISGSHLISAATSKSDIDLVLHDATAFATARRVAEKFMMELGWPLGFWEQAYHKRSSSLPFEEFLWHERRKHNKLSVDGVKIDLTFSPADQQPPVPTRKVSRVKLQGNIVCDSEAFYLPSRWRIASDSAEWIECWTATYCGQAQRGERVEVAGWLEQRLDGSGHQVLVGSSREAENEYIKVLRE